MKLIGRTVYLDQFVRFLANDSPNWLQAYSGLPGMGKTALLEELRNQASNECPTIWLDFRIKSLQEDYLAVLEATSRPLQNDVPVGMFETFERTVTELKKQQAPVVININQTMSATNHSTISHASQAVNRSELRHLIENYWRPINDMAGAWRTLVSATGQLVIFLDHWDDLVKGSGGNLSTWLVQELLLNGHRAQPQLRVVIAGERRVIDDPLWVNQPGLSSEELQPLTRDSADELMHRLGINSPAQLDSIWERTKGIPGLIELAADLLKSSPELDLSGVGREVEREAAHRWFFKQIIASFNTEAAKAALQHGVVLVDWNLEMLKEVLARSDLDQTVLDDLRSNALIQRSQDSPGYWVFNRIVREIQTLQIWEQEPRLFSQLHAKALQYYTT